MEVEVETVGMEGLGGRLSPFTIVVATRYM